MNGDFETGSLSPDWANFIPNCTTGPIAVVNTSYPNTGTYSLVDGSIGCADQTSQTFGIIMGQAYIVGFWIIGGGTGSNISAAVTIT